MKKLTAILVASTSLLWGGQVLAQANNAAPQEGQHHWKSESPDQRFNSLSQELNLTQDQKAKVKATFDETRQKIQAAIKEARTSAEAQLKSELTPEQYQKLQSLWQQHEHHGQSEGGSSGEGQ